MSKNRFTFLALITILLGCSTGEPYVPSLQPRAGVGEDYDFDFSWTEREDGFESESGIYPNVANVLEGEKPILTLYREDVTHRAVEDFFRQVAGPDEISLPMLYHADRNDLSLSLVFALAWVESRYHPYAQNANADSIDRGLFQLNDKSFVRLSTDDFFHPEISARHGTDYLRFALDYGGDERTAVAIYNAGLTRVLQNRTPESTLKHVERVMAYKASLERQFERYILQRFPVSL
ncbi:MAG: transglycosylase SLT domain-containing protein [Spirochaetaceae bacterium]